MGAIQRNRELFKETGIVLTGLPEQYQNDHPEHIIVRVDELHKVFTPSDYDSVTYDVEFLSPEIRSSRPNGPTRTASGYLNICIAIRPENRILAELFDFFSQRHMELELFGRQYDGHFFVRAFFPSKNRYLKQTGFFHILKQAGLDYRFPAWVDTTADPAGIDDNYKLFYKIFRDRYPKDIQRYLDMHLNESGYRDSVQQFILTDWSTPKLDLPTAQEARAILDESVYGMEEVKERLLEFLEGIRRSGSLAKNLLLVGPPGTGKTTLMQAVAKMLRLPMSVIPMSACADLEAFVGFARTYSGAQEGLATTALLSPVMEHPDGSREVVHQIAQVLFLNELDKTDPDKGHHGSVQTAVLRMADDNRNHFDIYHQASIDLKNVVLVADANDRSKIQKAVLDRFEVIEIPPYTDAEKAFIFRTYTFPKVLRAQNVSPTEVSVTDEALAQIVSTTRSSGIREMKQIAHRIVGNYLLHHAGQDRTVEYTPDMVKPFLPLKAIRHTTLVRQPGSVHAVTLHDHSAQSVDVQCIATHAKKWSFHLYGASDELLRQELEAAALCACRLLPFSGSYDVQVQLYGLQQDKGLVGQLGFPVFMAVLSAARRSIVEGVFHGGATLLGGLTCSACDEPDTVLSLVDRRQEGKLYTATGFSDRLMHPHSTEVLEFLDAKSVYSLFFGPVELQGAI